MHARCENKHEHARAVTKGNIYTHPTYHNDMATRGKFMDQMGGYIESTIIPIWSCHTSMQEKFCVLEKKKKKSTQRKDMVDQNSF